MTQKTKRSKTQALVEAQEQAPEPHKADWQEITNKTLQTKKRYPLKLELSEKRENTLEASTAKKDLLECQLYSATGFTDNDTSLELMNQVINANPSAKSVQKANIAIAMLDGIAPENPLEGLLATQMTACHNMAMEFTRRAMAEGQRTEFVDLNINRANKLMRTFTAQVEALQKLRNKGQQKITVQHVQVNQGGQAIIGDVNNGG